MVTRLFLMLNNIEYDEKWIAEHRLGLPSEIRQRISGYSNLNKIVTSILSERLLAYALDKVFQIDLSQQKRAWSEYGKPFFPDLGDIWFNISHSGDYILCGVSDSPIGVDIQQQVRTLKDRFAKRVMSTEEYEVFLSCQEPQKLICQVWALKESYLKYTGEGIRSDLRSITCYPRNNLIVSDRKSCRLSLFSQVEGYQIAVCSEEICLDEPEIVTFGSGTRP